MIEQRPRLTRRGYLDRLWILLFLMVTLFWGCDQVQQLLAPLPGAGGEATIKIGFLYTTPNRNNSRYGAELATMQLNEAGGVRGVPIQLIARGIPTQRFISEGISDTEYVTELALELIVEEQGISNCRSQPFNLCCGCRRNCAKPRHTDDGNLRHQSVRYRCGGLCVYGGVHRRLSGSGDGNICFAGFRGKDCRNPHAQGRCLFRGFIANLHQQLYRSWRSGGG